MLALSKLNLVALVELFVCWFAWILAFVQPRRLAGGKERVETAYASRLGVFVVMCGFGCIWAYIRPPGFTKTMWELVASMALGPPSVLLAWSAARHLGKQWRFEAAVNADHELVRTGPYRMIRHPIYCSMLGMLLTTGLAWTWWPLMVAGILLFLIGTEIRVRAEEGLLARHFGEEFWEYKLRTRAYLPFLR